MTRITIEKIASPLPGIVRARTEARDPFEIPDRDRTIGLISPVSCSVTRRASGSDGTTIEHLIEAGSQDWPLDLSFQMLMDERRRPT
ncbi:MAG: hypothetical protein U0556_17395 [Dehalococcoidia bacterium]